MDYTWQRNSVDECHIKLPKHKAKRYVVLSCTYSHSKQVLKALHVLLNKDFSL